MTTPLTIRKKISFQQNRHGEKVIAPAPVDLPKGRIPRVAKLLALAHRFNQLIRDGVGTDYADLARLGHVTRGRLTQIMNLLNLAPDIQEELLLLPPIHSGKDKVTERSLRPISAETGPKEVRAAPLAAQCEAGNVRLLDGPWNSAFIDELCTFPHGAHDDMVDSSSGAMLKLTLKKEFIVAVGLFFSVVLHLFNSGGFV